MFKTIVADPPWPYNDVKGLGNANPKYWHTVDGNVGSAPRYGAVSICDLKKLPVASITEEDAHLYLWTTNSFLVEAHELAVAWGFSPKTLLTWGKIKSDETVSMKAGYYFRGATEHVLFAVRGKLKLKGPCRPTLWLSPRLPHSVKPDWFYALVEEQSPEPRLEMFCRRPREGWSVWGDQVTPDSLEKVALFS